MNLDTERIEALRRALQRIAYPRITAPDDSKKVKMAIADLALRADDEKAEQERKKA